MKQIINWSMNFINQLLEFIEREFIRMCFNKQSISNFNSNDTIFFPFSIKTSKCSGSFDNIYDR